MPTQLMNNLAGYRSESALQQQERPRIGAYQAVITLRMVAVR